MVQGTQRTERGHLAQREDTLHREGTLTNTTQLFKGRISGWFDSRRMVPPRGDYFIDYFREMMHC